MSEQVWVPLERESFPLWSRVEMDDIAKALIAPFDFETDGRTEFYPWKLPTGLPVDFGLGVIVGASGTGKSLLLSRFGEEVHPTWSHDSPIASHFGSPTQAHEKLSAAGLMSVPDWVKPFHALSNGQRFRANLARHLYNDAVIDEFTSVVDRNVAKAASAAMSRYIRQNDVRRVVVSTCHRDVLEFLEPDWVIDLDRGAYCVGRWLRRPELVLDIYPCDNEVWSRFAPYHYLTQTLNRSSRGYLGVWEGQAVAFAATITYPSGSVKDAYRLHRLVVHPDYQGLGIGMTMNDAIAEHYKQNGKRFFVKTAHPRLGGYMDSSPLWKPTSKNHMKRKDAVAAAGRTRWDMNEHRWTYSHEYVGRGE